MIEWIPVTERLPEVDVVVFVCETHAPGEYSYHASWLTSDGLWDVEASELAYLPRVTHWAAIVPPK